MASRSDSTGSLLFSSKQSFMNKMQATHAIGVYSIRQETIYTLYTRIIYVRGEITRHGSAANGIADITRQKIGCAQAKRAHEMPGIAGKSGLAQKEHPATRKPCIYGRHTPIEPPEAALALDALHVGEVPRHDRNLMG